MRPDGPRDDFAGPETGPKLPFPIKLQGPVIKGFGRGSKEVSLNPRRQHYRAYGMAYMVGFTKSERTENCSVIRAVNKFAPPYVTSTELGIHQI